MTAASFAFFTAFAGFGEEAFLAAAGPVFFAFKGVLRAGLASVVDSPGTVGVEAALAPLGDFLGFLGTVF